MTKSTVIIFISFFAVLFRLEKKVSESFAANIADAGIENENCLKHVIFFFLELFPSYYRRNDICRLIPFHLQVHRVQSNRLYPPSNCVVQLR
jgi:hypothetical protein